jgi:hypothetical protein
MRAWAIKYRGKLVAGTVEPKERDSWYGVPIRLTPVSWWTDTAGGWVEKAKKNGFRAVRVTVTEAAPKPKKKARRS